MGNFIKKYIEDAKNEENAIALYTGRIGRDKRRLKVWELHLKGYSASRISEEMHLAKTTVESDIAKSYAIARPEIVQSTTDHLAKYIAQQELIIATGFEMLERIDAIEDMWVEKVFGPQPEEVEAEDDFFDDGGPRYKPRGIDYGRVQVKNDRSSILGEIARASTAIAKAKGLLSEKITISYDMMTEEQLTLQAEKLGIDLVALGIRKAEIINITPEARQIAEGTPMEFDEVMERINNRYKGNKNGNERREETASHTGDEESGERGMDTAS